MEGNNHRQGSKATTRMVCAACFLTFSSLWLYCFQADLLTVAQHALSGGLTHYDRTIGTIIITVVLFVLQLNVYAVTRLSSNTHAMTYAPSFIVLAFLSDISVSSSRGVQMGRQWWLLALAAMLWAGAVWTARQMMPPADSNRQATGLFSARTWINLVQMAAMMLFVAAVGNTNAVLHFRAHAETAIMDGDNSEALRVGRESLETDSQLTMLRAFALSKEGALGEKLFCYPIAGSGEALLPMNDKPMLLPPDTIWRHLGAKPAFPMKAYKYYQLLETDSLATKAVADYVLCAKLIDRDLGTFVTMLPRYYNLSSTLPRHYREALVLYAHKHPGKVAFRDDSLESEWLKMKELEKQYPGESQRRVKMLENYRNTYWRYYKAQRP